MSIVNAPNASILAENGREHCQRFIKIGSLTPKSPRPVATERAATGGGSTSSQPPSQKLLHMAAREPLPRRFRLSSPIPLVLPNVDERDEDAVVDATNEDFLEAWARIQTQPYFQVDLADLACDLSDV